MKASKTVNRSDAPGALILLEERQYQIRSDGRVESTLRRVYRVDQQEAVEDWSSVEQEYRPWHQEPPNIRARVILPGGEVKWLDTKTVAHSPAREFDSNIFSDTRIARAPLPSVSRGAIIEYEVVVRDRTPLFGAGVAERVPIPQDAPLERFHLIIRAEPGINLQMASRQIPENSIRRESGKTGSRVEIDFGPLDPPKEFEGNLPFDESGFPYVTFSTGSSWSAVATAYASQVDSRIGSESGMPIDPADTKGTVIEIAAKLAARLHKQVRYTGVEFGEAAIVPVRPSEAVSRGYGDCKDKSTLLVAMLRAAGLKADVALLDSGAGPDVDPQTPGMGQFNHAIVYVQSTPPLWIDATAAEVRIGLLPPGNQGRFALIANGRTTGLVRIPESTTNDNWNRNLIEIRMSELGQGDVRAVIEASGGWFEATARSTYGGDEKRAKQGLEALVKTSFNAREAGEYKLMARDDHSGPYRLEVVARKTAIALTGSEDAAAAITPTAVFEFIPFGLLRSFGEKDEEKKPRKHDFVFTFPFRSEYRYRIVPPAGFRLTSKLDPVDTKLGPATLKVEFLRNTDSTTEVVYRLDTTKRRWTAEEVESFRSDYRKLALPERQVLILQPETAELLAAGQTRKAIDLIRDHVRKNPDNAMAHARFSRLLISAGMGAMALMEAKESVRLDPGSSAAWTTLGHAYQHDTFGRFLKGSWNYAEAEKCLRKALELDPADLSLKAALAILLEHDPRGWRYAKDSKVNEAIALYREVLEKNQLPHVRTNLAFALLRTGQLTAAKQEAGKGNTQADAMVPLLIQALQEGAGPTIASATLGQTEARQRAITLGSISYNLLTMREYPLAHTFMTAAARAGLPDLATQAELIGKRKRWDKTVLPENDPYWPVQHLMLEAMRGASVPDTIRQLLSARYTSASWKSMIPSLANAVTRMQTDLAGQGTDDEALVDYVASLTAFEKIGDEKYGYRVTSLMPGWGQLPAVYVVPENGKYRIIGFAPDGLDAVGDMVLALLDSKDVTAAQWWLDRIVADAQSREDGTGRPAITSLWAGRTPLLRGPAAARTAASTLVSGDRGSAAAVQVLQTARQKATIQLERDQIDKATCEVLSHEKLWEELRVPARRLLSSKLFAEEGFRYLLKAATGSGKWKDLETEAEKRASANATNSFAVIVTALAKARQGDYDGAVTWIRKMLTADPQTGSRERTVAAWILLRSGKADRGLLEKIRSGNIMKSESRDVLAAIHATFHEADDAITELRGSADKFAWDHLPGTTWLAYAAVCSELGFTEEAEAARKHAGERGDVEAQLLSGVSDR